MTGSDENPYNLLHVDAASVIKDGHGDHRKKGCTAVTTEVPTTETPTTEVPETAAPTTAAPTTEPTEPGAARGSDTTTGAVRADHDPTEPTSRR